VGGSGLADALEVGRRVTFKMGPSRSPSGGGGWRRIARHLKVLLALADPFLRPRCEARRAEVPDRRVACKSGGGMGFIHSYFNLHPFFHVGGDGFALIGGADTD